MLRERPRDHERRSTRAVLTAVASARTAGRVAVVSLSFWTAVCLPVVLLAMFLSGIDTPTEGAEFLALTAVEGVALVAGRTYGATD